MKVTSSEELGSLRYEAQRQAATEVVLGEVRRLSVQGDGDGAHPPQGRRNDPAG